jgi:hypothetical protein
MLIIAAALVLNVQNLIMDRLHVQVENAQLPAIRNIMFTMADVRWIASLTAVNMVLNVRQVLRMLRLYATPARNAHIHAAATRLQMQKGRIA